MSVTVRERVWKTNLSPISLSLSLLQTLAPISGRYERTPVKRMGDLALRSPFLATYSLVLPRCPTSVKRDSFRLSVSKSTVLNVDANTG